MNLNENPRGFLCPRPVVILNENPAGFRASAASVPSGRAQVASGWRWIGSMWPLVGTKAAPMAIHVRSMPVVNLNENPRGFLTSAASLGSMWPLVGPNLAQVGPRLVHLGPKLPQVGCKSTPRRPHEAP